MYRLGLWSFYKGVLSDDNLPKTTTFEWFQKWSSYTGLTVAQILLRLVLPIFEVLHLLLLAFLAGIYLFKINNGRTRTMSEICSKLQ